MIAQRLHSYFAGSLYPIFSDLLQISYKQLKDLLQRCWDNIFWNVLSLKERHDRDKKITDCRVNAKLEMVGMSLTSDILQAWETAVIDYYRLHNDCIMIQYRQTFVTAFFLDMLKILKDSQRQAVSC